MRRLRNSVERIEPDPATHVPPSRLRDFRSYRVFLCGSRGASRIHGGYLAYLDRGRARGRRDPDHRRITRAAALRSATLGRSAGNSRCQQVACFDLPDSLGFLSAPYEARSLLSIASFDGDSSRARSFRVRVRSRRGSDAKDRQARGEAAGEATPALARCAAPPRARSLLPRALGREARRSREEDSTSERGATAMGAPRRAAPHHHRRRAGPRGRAR